MKQLLCRDLNPGDVLLRMATQSFSQKIIQLGQRLTGQPNAFLAHAAIALDTQFAIEAQKVGVTANHLAMKNKSCVLLESHRRVPRRRLSGRSSPHEP